MPQDLVTKVVLIERFEGFLVHHMIVNYINTNIPSEEQFAQRAQLSWGSNIHQKRLTRVIRKSRLNVEDYELLIDLVSHELWMIFTVPVVFPSMEGIARQ